MEFAIGFGDQASGGLTRYVRQYQGIDDPSLDCSGWYSAGGWASVAVEVVMGAEALLKAGGKFALRRALKKESGVLFSKGGSGAGALDSGLFNRIKSAFQRNGGVIDQSAEAQRYLNARGAEAATFNAETMVLKTNPTNAEVFEELIHTAR